jgi:hypothetical protein
MFDVHSEDAETGPSVLSTLGRKACLSRKKPAAKGVTCVCPTAGTVRVGATCVTHRELFQFRYKF